jgi:hypothetical protein
MKVMILLAVNHGHCQRDSVNNSSSLKLLRRAKFRGISGFRSTGLHTDKHLGLDRGSRTGGPLAKKHVRARLMGCRLGRRAHFCRVACKHMEVRHGVELLLGTQN